MHNIATHLSLLSLIACSGQLNIDDSQTTTTPTTTVPTTTTTTETVPTTTTTPTTTVPTTTTPDGTRLDFITDIKTNDLLVTLVSIDLVASKKSDGVVFADQLNSAQITGNSATLYVPDAPSDTLIYIDGFSLGLFSIVAFDDGDGNEQYTYGEDIAGMGEVMLAYIEGTVPSGSEYADLVPGWNPVLLDYDSGNMPVSGTLDAIPLPINQLPRETISGGGTNDITSDWYEINIAAFPFAADMDYLDDISTLIYDERVSATFEFAFNGSPPIDHYVTEDGLTYAGETFLTYADIDNSYHLNDGDLPLSAVCYDDSPVLFYYLQQANDLSTAFMFMAMPHIAAGWNAFSIIIDASGNETQNVLSDDDLNSLEAHWSCQF